MGTDAIYIFRHSVHNDEEIRFSLRSVAKRMPWIRKVWIFGDKPEWLTEDTSRIEHVPHESIAWIGNFKTPVVNTFIMHYLIASLPQLSQEYVHFCDDYILLKDVDLEYLRRVRYLSDMSSKKPRELGLYIQALWRTHDLLKRLGYEGINYEVHIPVVMTKQRVLNAYRDFREFVTQDRFYGPLAQVVIFNHARKTEGFPITRLSAEATYVGIHRKPVTRAEIETRCQDRVFLNFDDKGYDETLRAFLTEMFPEPSFYEKDWVPPSTSVSLPASPSVSASSALGLGVPQPTYIEESTAHCTIFLARSSVFAPENEKSLIDLKEAGYRIVPFDVGPDLEVVRGRLVAQALADGCRETLWLDSSIWFTLKDIEHLRKSGRPIAAALYPRVGRRALEFLPLPETRELQFGPRGGWIEIQGAPGGFLYVRREVYETIERELPLASCEDRNGTTFPPYFQSIVDSSQTPPLFLEDTFAFCHRARRCGIPVAADTRLRLWRTSGHVASWEEAGLERQRFTHFSYKLMTKKQPPVS